MEKYKFEEYKFLGTDENQKKIEQLKIAKECLLVANDANFPTDFQDVYDHLFEDESYIRVFIKDQNNVVKGFAIICNELVLNNCLIMHVHGIVLSPEVQEEGLGKELINFAVCKYQPDVVTAKTHNPRCFNMFCNILDKTCAFYPNEEPIPDYIYKIVKNDKFIDVVDENLIYKDAYPDVKIQQSQKNPIVDRIFKKVGPYDAQAVVVVINPNIKEKTEVKTLKKEK